MDVVGLLGYASGLYFIKPDLQPQVLLATLAFIHLCDGILCLIIARHGGRTQTGWTLTGLILGVWGALPLLLLRRGEG